MVTKQLNIKNRSYYFWDDQINIKNFNPALLKLDKCNELVLTFITSVISQKNLNTILTV